MCNQCLDPDAWFSTHDSDADPQSDWGSAIQLRLRRHVPSATAGSAPRGKPVLLLHGASANHRTFTTPNGLADYLFARGFDPWLLDWRGSSLVSDCPQNEATLKHESDLYTFNSAAREDVPAAIARMRRDAHVGQQRIALIGHCMGAGVAAEAVACGATGGEVDRIVLLALGLFYEAAIDSRLKSEERILERLALNVVETPCIDPRVEENGKLRIKWPTDLDRLYEAWPSGLRAHQKSKLESQAPATAAVVDASRVSEMCNRLSFMYGMPYRHDNLASGIHDVTGGADPQRPGLLDHFGGMPLKMYLHAARNLRAGQATWFRSTGTPIVTDRAREQFIKLARVTLITGELNRLWHRDSIDRMHEWLCRGNSTVLRKIKKHVLPDYAHQDLLWGPNSVRDVYTRIDEGLTRSAHTGGITPSGTLPPSPV